MCKSSAPGTAKSTVRIDNERTVQSLVNVTLEQFDVVFDALLVV